ncbi:MAG: hypothetical protein WAL89_09350 [Candidatus Sulfotelmatobacter sp.]
MMINWQVLLTTLGGGTAFLAVAAWLIRTALDQALTRDAEAFKARLKADADVETEKLKSSLQMIAFEHQIRFSNLHAKRAEVIADIYSQMVEVEQHGKRFVYVEVFNQTRQQAYSETMNRLVDFFFFLEKRRIYLPENICNLMQNFVDTIRKHVIRTNIYEPIEQPLNEKILEEKIKVIQEVNEAFEGSIPAARTELEKEFRRLLGAEHVAKVPASEN